MIPDREIKEKARESGVPPSTIERDYAQSWLLAHLSPITMALKGGTVSGKYILKTTAFPMTLILPCLNLSIKIICKPQFVMRQSWPGKSVASSSKKTLALLKR